ncbi:hypothetical protein [Xenorhabdus ishibashii]|uniref:Uncharacterized protein n=1 Tax=Xenorhabdus ishibashii TaxID=1034471 RepID=A0A2D0KHQ4_9GAMM|nr:hypothetical protein [Xenorhabdus ishibashii]PHM62956.1 hypothetical protein Xish_02179 [Xenorhabdus ishibashii]
MSGYVDSAIVVETGFLPEQNVYNNHHPHSVVENDVTERVSGSQYGKLKMSVLVGATTTSKQTKLKNRFSEINTENFMIHDGRSHKMNMLISFWYN